MTKTVVSIIIPCYEQQSLLKRALDSLNDQDVDLDVIVIDDGSFEAVYIPTTNYKFSIKLIRQQNGGLSAARNTRLFLKRRGLLPRDSKSVFAATSAGLVPSLV